MKRYNKEDAVKRVIECVHLYDNAFTNKLFLFVYRSRKDGVLRYFEMVAYPQGYLHLTGLKYNPGSAMKFFHACKMNRLSVADIEFKKDDYSDSKLEILDKISGFSHYAKITTNYNRGRPNLICDRLAGNNSFCIGFIEQNGLMVLSSLLCEDIHAFGKDNDQVLMIFSRNMQDMLYSKLEYHAKGVDPRKIVCPENIASLIKLSASDDDDEKSNNNQKNGVG